MRRLVWGIVIAGSILGSAGKVEARDNYGAIAYSPSTGAYGWSYDHVSQASAVSAALAECSQRAGDCQVPLWFRNACGALAVGSGGGFGTGWGTSRGIAERYALRVCRQHAGSCSVRRWVCTTR
jgi:serine/threonine-protein kinase